MVSSDVVDAKIKAPESWIRRNDDIDPVIWLASKEARRPLSADDPTVVRIRQALQRPRRGSWNWTAWSRIAPRSLRKCWRRTVSRKSRRAHRRDSASVVDPKRGKETYGELCQFYFTLRHGGADRDAALTRLIARYGSPGASDGKIPLNYRPHPEERRGNPRSL